MAPSFTAMVRLAFVVAVVFALFGGRSNGNPSGAVFGPVHNVETCVTNQQGSEFPASGCAAGPAVTEPDLPSDDEALTSQDDETVCSEAESAADRMIGCGVGPSRSHARPMDRPPRV
jgi:hypothetical protein